MPSKGSSASKQGMQIGRVVARLAKQAELALADVDLSPAQYRALSFLSEDDRAAAASRLADRLAVSRPTITALVDGLVSRGLVERSESPGDRRRVDHALTPAGKRALAAADSAIQARLATIAAHLDPTDAASATNGLAAWGRALDEARAARLQERSR
jgi:long-chain acyl-CoA synthetase